MDDTAAQSALDEASRLAHQAKRDARWYARYLLLFAVGTVVVAVGIAGIGGSAGVAITTAIWLLLIAGLSVYAHRQKATIKRFKLVHGLVIGTWAILWLTTVVVGNLVYPGNLVWWVGGGVACAIPPVVGALVVLRSTR